MEHVEGLRARGTAKLLGYVTVGRFGRVKYKGFPFDPVPAPETIPENDSIAHHVFIVGLLELPSGQWALTPGPRHKGELMPPWIGAIHKAAIKRKMKKVAEAMFKISRKPGLAKIPRGPSGVIKGVEGVDLSPSGSVVLRS